MGDFVTTHVLDDEGTGSPENGPGMKISGFSGERGSTPGFFRRSQRIFMPSPCPPTNLSRSSGGTATFSLLPVERSMFRITPWYPGFPLISYLRTQPSHTSFCLIQPLFFPVQGRKTSGHVEPQHTRAPRRDTA